MSAKYHNDAARSEEQLKQMKELEQRGVCIFCPVYIKEARESIELETTNWMVKKNDFPYEDTKLHLILIPKTHVKTVSELSKKTREEFLEVVVKCEKTFGLKSYALGMRSGDMRYNGGSVEHLHAHIVVGDTASPRHKPVRFKMSSK